MPLDGVPLMDTVQRPGWLATWYQASRPQFFVATLIPLTLGTVLASREVAVNWVMFLVVVLSSFLVHLGTNLANDLFDHLAGTDDGESIGGSRVLQQGLLTTRHLVTALVLLYGTAALGGLYLLLATREWWLAIYMLLAFCSSLFYTAPPLRLGYHGLGELTVFVNMGPVMVTGAYCVQTGYLDWDALLISLPTGIMVAMILYFQSLPDIETDRLAGKRTIATRLGRDSAIGGIYVFGIAAVATIVALVALRELSLIALLSLLTLPILRRIAGLLRSTPDWQEVHGRGKVVRLFYLANGILMILATRLLI
ncbi:1,4-dihydroxy-2-naphthoate octaprenyltransferase [bacterium]|nr:1,4-dihydroxy-2-naphthoate octaprenyltransferase [bacterium]